MLEESFTADDVLKSLTPRQIKDRLGGSIYCRVHVQPLQRSTMICSSSQQPAIHVDKELDLPSAEFLNSINRGGLVKPTDFVYQLVLHCWRVFEEVQTSAELKCKLLQSPKQRQLFCKVMDQATYSTRSSICVWCYETHLPCIVIIHFPCF